MQQLRLLHAIHDFLPRHRAGSEIYAFELCRELQRQHHVTVLCAEYDPARQHGSVTWRDYEGLTVVEVVNNWTFDSFAEAYQSRTLNRTFEHVLRAVRPDVLHIHNLLNLSLDLPSLARAAGIPSVATLHDYTLVCPSGGQRVHLAEEHVCDVIDPVRCARCFPQSHFHSQMAFGRVVRHAAAVKPALKAAAWLQRRAPSLFATAEAAVKGAETPIGPADIATRLAKVQEVFETVDLFVAPAAALGAEYRQLGIPAHKLKVSDYGFVKFDRLRSSARRGPLRIGFVGTLVWHKGVHVLVEAATKLPPDRYELKIFGDPHVFAQYSAKLQEQAGNHPIRLMGAFDNRRAQEIYSEIDVLVVSSLWPENSPLVIHEAFMAGVPVVGARMGGIPDLVTDGINGLLYDAYSPDALATALRRLITEGGLLERFATRLPEVKSIEQDAREWNAVYDAVLSKPPVMAGVPA